MAQETPMTPEAALATLRRATQVFSFIQDLHRAAQEIVAAKVAQDVVEKGTADAQALYEQVLAAKASAEADYAAFMATVAQTHEQEAAAHATEVHALMDRLKQKRQAVENACAQLDREYLERHEAHSQTMRMLEAAIAEREAHLARLSERLGALRADFEMVGRSSWQQ